MRISWCLQHPNERYADSDQPVCPVCNHELVVEIVDTGDANQPLGQAPAEGPATAATVSEDS